MSNTVTIGSARIDERGHTTGGKAGDQAREVSTQPWYKHSKGWIVIRPKEAVAAERIAEAMEHACANPRIGYDQAQRLSLWNAVKDYGYDPAKAPTLCETDCSALVRICCAYAGIITPNFTTADEVKTLKATGRFDVLTDTKQSHLLRGDILCTKNERPYGRRTLQRVEGRTPSDRARRTASQDGLQRNGRRGAAAQAQAAELQPRPVRQEP